MSFVSQQLLTAHDLWLLPENGLRRELVRGEVIESMPPGGRHGGIAAILAMLLRLWVRQSAGGYVGVEAGFVLARDPDTVRGPHISYVRADRIPPSGPPDSYGEVAPDLAVEIVSPNETADEVREKVRDFLAAGTPLVWVIYPRSQEVIAHTPDGLARTFSAGETIEHSAILPGFSCPVAELLA